MAQPWNAAVGAAGAAMPDTPRFPPEPAALAGQANSSGEAGAVKGGLFSGQGERGGSSGRAAPSHGTPEEELCFFHVPKATGPGSEVPARAGPGPTAAFLRCSGLPSPLSRCSCPGGGSARKARTAGAAGGTKALGRQLSPGAGCVWEQSSSTDSELGAGQAEPILSPPGRQGEEIPPPQPSWTSGLGDTTSSAILDIRARRYHLLNPPGCQG